MPASPDCWPDEDWLDRAVMIDLPSEAGADTRVTFLRSFSTPAINTYLGPRDVSDYLKVCFG